MHHVTHDIFAPHVSLAAVRRLSSITFGVLQIEKICMCNDVEKVRAQCSSVHGVL